MQQFDLKKPKTQRPTNSNGHAPLELKDLKAEVPEVDDLISQIDKLLQKNKPPQGCGCGGGR